MNLRQCDCCGKDFKELSRVEVGKKNPDHHSGGGRWVWHVCADCLNNVVPRIPKDTEVPLLSLRFPFGPRGK